jgi:hypothetical protein
MLGEESGLIKSRIAKMNGRLKTTIKVGKKDAV